MRKIIQMALEGNLKAIEMLLPILFRGEAATLAGEATETPGVAASLDEETLRPMLERFQQLSARAKES